MKVALRSVATVVAAVALVLTSAQSTPAQAAPAAGVASIPAPELNQRVTGPFLGTTDFVFENCEFVFQQFNATYKSTAGRGGFHTQGCVLPEPTGNYFPYSGSFTVHAPGGGTLSGTVTGRIDAVETGAFDFTLAVQRGAGDLSQAVGSVQVHGMWNFTTGAIAGTLTGQLRRRVPTITVTDARVAEGDSGQLRMDFFVRLSAAFPRTVTVHFITADNTARRISDYEFKQGTLTFSPGETGKRIGVKVDGDRQVEPDETLSLVLFEPSNAVLADSIGVGAILNDD